MGSCERGMNPVAMTIINPRKEYWSGRGSNQRPPVLNSCTLPTKLSGSAQLGAVVFGNMNYLTLYSIDTHFNTSTTDSFCKH